MAERGDEIDPNNVPEQRDEMRPTVVRADRAEGVPGDEPPRAGDEPSSGHRTRSAAGLTSIWETVNRGVRYMGTGRSLKTLLAINQKDGFDCPSCAWPDPDGHRKVAEFSENGAKAVVSEAMTARVPPDFFAAHPIPALLEKSDLRLDQQGRITHPMWRPEGTDRYQPISWDDAFALIARELNGLASADEATFYTSGRAGNEAAFLSGLFARQFGTNNLPDCSNMCHESSGTGLHASIGVGKATVK